MLMHTKINITAK